MDNWFDRGEKFNFSRRTTKEKSEAAIECRKETIEHRIAGDEEIWHKVALERYRGEKKKKKRKEKEHKTKWTKALRFYLLFVGVGELHGETVL